MSTLNGVLLVDKPSGLTSHDVVVRVRKLLGERRVGHTGTLDPFATGLMLLCIGRATRLSRFLTQAAKSYEATIRFGYATDTYDRTGEPTGPLRELAPDRAELERVLEGLKGRMKQIPPAFSAKKVGGKRLYRLARAGVSVSPSPVEVEIHEIELVELDGARALIRVKVSSGTYVRSLAHDIGVQVATGAHVEELRRTAVGSFGVADAFELDRLDRSSAPEALLTPNEALRDLPEARVGAVEAGRLANGLAPALEAVSSKKDVKSFAGQLRVLGPDGELLAVAEPDADRRVLRPVLVWKSALRRETP